MLLEDGVAVLGLCLATGGIVATYLTHQPLWDSLGSIIVGVLLGAVAIFLVLENRALLLGRAAPASLEKRFREVLLARHSVRIVRDVKSRQLTPDEFIFKAEIEFDEPFVAARLDEVLAADLDLSHGGARPAAVRAIAAAATRVLADETDAVEAAVRTAIPEAKHIDLEIDRPPRG